MEMYIIIYNKPLFTFSSFSYGRKSKKKKKERKSNYPEPDLYDSELHKCSESFKPSCCY